MKRVVQINCLPMVVFIAFTVLLVTHWAELNAFISARLAG